MFLSRFMLFTPTVDDIASCKVFITIKIPITKAPHELYDITLTPRPVTFPLRR